MSTDRTDYICNTEQRAASNQTHHPIQRTHQIIAGAKDDGRAANPRGTTLTITGTEAFIWWSHSDIERGTRHLSGWGS